jgi:hypothetical protein
MRTPNASNAICQGCGHDLAVRVVPVNPPQAAPSGTTSNGKVYCTNDRCDWSRREYKLTPFIEDGKQHA